MPFRSFLNRHSKFTAQADAYADGELRGRDLARFETHLAGCERCAAAVAGARTLKASLGALPTARAPRSFRITRAMLESQGGNERSHTGTPLYLGLARATAALSVAAFATAFVLVSFDSSEGSRDETAGASFEAADADSAPLATAEPRDSNYESAPDPVTPQIGPATTAGASGSSLEPPKTVPMENATDRATQSQAPDATPAVPAAGGEQFGPLSATGVDTAVAEEDDADGSGGAVFALGAVAAIAVAGLVALEVRRRRL